MRLSSKRLSLYCTVGLAPWLLGTLILLCPLAATAGRFQDPSVYRHEPARELVATVNRAADLLAEKGQAAFEEFAQPDSPWMHGERFLFVFGEDGTCLFHPEHPAYLGKNVLNAKDAQGRPMVRWLIETASHPDRPYGWVHYFSPPPEALFPSWKSSYVVGVRGPEGRLYALGSGLYDMPVEKQFVVDLVDRAADLIERQGEQAFQVLHEEASRYNLLGTYVYVFTMDGKTKVDPAYPTDGERSALDYKDATGHYFVRDAINRLGKQERAWIMYMWPRPGQAAPSRKLMFARRVEAGGETYLVGSDLYLSHPIWLRF